MSDFVNIKRTLVLTSSGRMSRARVARTRPCPGARRGVGFRRPPRRSLAVILDRVGCIACSTAEQGQDLSVAREVWDAFRTGAPGPPRGRPPAPTCPSRLPSASTVLGQTWRDMFSSFCRPVSYRQTRTRRVLPASGMFSLVIIRGGLAGPFRAGSRSRLPVVSASPARVAAPARRAETSRTALWPTVDGAPPVARLVAAGSRPCQRPHRGSAPPGSGRSLPAGRAISRACRPRGATPPRLACRHGRRPPGRHGFPSRKHGHGQDRQHICIRDIGRCVSKSCDPAPTVLPSRHLTAA